MAADEILVATGPHAERRGARARRGRGPPHGRGHRRGRLPPDDQPPHLRGRRRVPPLEVHPRGRRRGADRGPERALRLAGRRRASRLVMPWCTYTDPEVAHVGLSEREARERGIAIDTLVRRWRTSTAPVTDDETEGFLKVHVRQDTRPDRRRDHRRAAGGRPDQRGDAGHRRRDRPRPLLGRDPSLPDAQAEAVRHLADQHRRRRLTPFVRRALGTWLRWTR